MQIEQESKYKSEFVSSIPMAYTKDRELTKSKNVSHEYLWAKITLTIET